MYIRLTSLNILVYAKLIEYMDELNISREDKKIYSFLLTSDLRNDMYAQRFLNSKRKIHVSEKNISEINEIIDSYIMDKMFPFVKNTNGIEITYEAIVDPKDIDGSYFPLHTLGERKMRFEISFATKNDFNLFKIKHPDIMRELNIFNQITYTII